MSTTSDTRGRILSAARIISSESSNLTMGGIAARAGLSRQAVYLHFQDRDALLASMAAELAFDGAAIIAAAPSARAATAALVAQLALVHPRMAPLARHGAQAPEDHRADCLALAERFQAEGALAPHLSAEAAADLLWSLTGLALWESLVTGCGWSAGRYASHITFLAVGAVTK